MAVNAPPMNAAAPPGAEPFTPPVIPEFEILPMKGLPVVIAIMAGMVAAIAANKLWALEFYHVVGGGLWTGIDLFVGLVVGPILGKLSVQGRIDFLTRFMPKMLLIMPTLVTMTLGAGWQLSRRVGLQGLEYPDHWWLTASYIVVGVMSIIALGVLEPANLAILFELKKPRPNGELLQKLSKRFVYTAGITGAMQVVTLIIMTRLATW